MLPLVPEASVACTPIVLRPLLVKAHGVDLDREPAEGGRCGWPPCRCPRCRVRSRRMSLGVGRVGSRSSRVIFTTLPKAVLAQLKPVEDRLGDVGNRGVPSVAVPPAEPTGAGRFGSSASGAGEHHRGEPDGERPAAERRGGAGRRVAGLGDRAPRWSGRRCGRGGRGR